MNIGMVFTQWAGVLILSGIAWVLTGRRASGRRSEQDEAAREHNGQPRTPSPWHRFWAKSIDYYPFLIAFNLGAAFAPQVFPSPILEVVLWAILSIFSLILYEAAWLSSTGITPGKALLGIRVTTRDGSRLAFSQALSRSAQVMARGFGLMIFFPILQAFTFRQAYKAVKVSGTAPWDWEYALVQRPVHGVRTALGYGLGSVALVAMVLMVVAVKQINKAALKRDYTRTPAAQSDQPSAPPTRRIFTIEDLN